MNFFKFYMGDYQRDTAHLSLSEHGAYFLMLQTYYATERPLPAGAPLYRLLRAQTKAEQAAIAAVVRQFWKLTDAGLVNERADKEITKARAQAETNRTIAKAREGRRKEARKEHESCDESLDDKRTKEPTNGSTNDQPNHSHSQKPDSLPQSVERNSTVPHALDAETAARLLQAKGVQIDPNSPLLAGWLKGGADESDFAHAIAVARSRKPEPEPIPEKYLARIFDDPENWASPEPLNGSSGSWWTSNEGTTAMAAKLGMMARGGESWDEFRKRIHARLAEQRRQEVH